MAYDILDHPEVTFRLFHPRPESGWEGESHQPRIAVPVADDVVVDGCCHMTERRAPTILFFHGNGEIVADYNEAGPLYNRMGVNFIPVDYRGYGRSTGMPSVSTMMADCHVIFHTVRQWLSENGYTGALAVMGRSLGSASALELAARYPEQIGALIVESGFARAEPLLRLIGVDVAGIGYRDAAGFQNTGKIAEYPGPTLIIHAREDHIIPFSDGEALFAASRSAEKTLLEIPGADHNNLFYVGHTQYLEAISRLMETVRKG